MEFYRNLITLAHIKRAITKHITSYYTILHYKNNMHIITKNELKPYTMLHMQ